MMEYTYTDQFLIGLVDFFVWGKWLFLLAVFLTLGDLKFGIEASRFRKEPIKRSRAVRRTLDKICGYLIWIVMAYTFGQAFGLPFGIELLPLIILIIIYGVELESIFVNYFGAKGKKIRVNFLSFFRSKTDLIEIKEEENEDCKK
ncbi:MAG: phage holin family protein [Tannerellaceae bacterium]|nr:phage holin family protein [Tannerellaceae bacterium]